MVAALRGEVGTAQSDGEGRILAQGCTEGLRVASGQATQAPVSLVPYVP